MIGVILAILIITAGFLAKYWKSILYNISWRWNVYKMRSLHRTAYPIVGHSYLFPTDTAEFFDFVQTIGREVCEKKMDKMVTLWLGPVPLAMVCHPESVEVLLRSSKHMKKSFVYRFVLPWIGTGLLTSWGKKWQTRRRLITPTFHFNILQDFLDVMNEQSELMMKKITQQLDNNEDIDLSKHITLCALDIICETAMGKSVNAQQHNDSEYVKALYRISDIVQLRQKTPTLWWDWAFDKMKLGGEQKSLLKTLHSFTQGVIKHRMNNQQNNNKEKKKRMAFLDVLLNSTDENGHHLELSDIQEEVDTFMFEGHDTTAAAMTWAAYMLGKHPHVQQKVHDELDQVFGDDYNRPVTMEDVRKVQYLEQVIKESLRLYPSVPLIGRVTSEDCVLDGYTVPKGTEITVFVYTLHRNPNVWEEPDKFDPERFNKDNSTGRHPYAFIPFSAGPRNCIGQKFALQEEKVLLIYLLRQFTIVSHDDESTLKKSGDLILRPAQKLNISLVKRN